MRTVPRSAAVSALMAFAMASTVEVALAHDQTGILDLQAIEFEGVAAKAAEHSRAPRSHAPCVQGFAGEFPCDNVDLLSFVPSADLGGSLINDIWGWIIMGLGGGLLVPTFLRF